MRTFLGNQYVIFIRIWQFIQTPGPVDPRSKGRLETAKIPVFDRVDWNNTSVFKQYQKIINMISAFTSPVSFAVLAPLYFLTHFSKTNFFSRKFFLENLALLYGQCPRADCNHEQVIMEHVWQFPLKHLHKTHFNTPALRGATSLVCCMGHTLIQSHNFFIEDFRLCFPCFIQFSLKYLRKTHFKTQCQTGSLYPVNWRGRGTAGQDWRACCMGHNLIQSHKFSIKAVFLEMSA